MVLKLLFFLILLVSLRIDAFVSSRNAFSLNPKTNVLNLRETQLSASNTDAHGPVLASLYHWDTDYGMNKVEAGSVTAFVIGFNVLMFLLQKTMPSLTQTLLKHDYDISRGQLYRLLTSTIIHSNFNHLAANTVSLWNMGWQVENLLGPTRFALIYLGSGVIGNILTYLMGTSPYSLGASGCLFGLWGGLASHYYRHRHSIVNWEHVLENSARLVGIELIRILTSRGARIDHAGHVGGFVGGIICEILTRSLYSNRFASGLAGRVGQLLQSLNPFRNPPVQSYQWRLF